MPRIGTLPLAGFCAWGSPSCNRGTISVHLTAVSVEATGSHVPCQSLDQARAASVPDTVRATMQAAPGLLPGLCAKPGFDVIRSLDRSSAVRLRSPSWSSPDAISLRLFPQRSPPRLFTDAACGGLRPPPAGRSQGALPHLWRSIDQTAAIFYIVTFLSFVAHARSAWATSIHELNRGTAGMCAGSTPDPSRAGWRLPWPASRRSSCQ